MVTTTQLLSAFRFKWVTHSAGPQINLASTSVKYLYQQYQDQKCHISKTGHIYSKFNVTQNWPVIGSSRKAWRTYKRLLTWDEIANLSQVRPSVIWITQTKPKERHANTYLPGLEDFLILKWHCVSVIGICVLLIPVTASCFADLILQLKMTDCQTKGQKRLQLVLLIISSIWRKQTRD